MSQQASPSSQHKGDLTSGPIGRTLMVFALPTLGSSILQSINGSVNAVWIGRLLGEAALTATSNANLVLFLLLGAIFGAGMAVTILIGHAVGARDMNRAKRVVGTGITLFIMISATIALLGWLFTPAILALLGTPAEALPYAIAYLRVIFAALPLMNVLTFLMMALRGAGDARTPFWFMGLAALIDVGLNPLLILGVGPLPRMGIAGSATSTLIAQLISLIAMLVLLHIRRHPLRLIGEDLAYLRPDPRLLHTIITKGLPMGLQMIVISSAALLLMGLVNAHGTRTAAAYGVVTQLWTYIQMPALAIGAAVSSMAAQNIGARRWDRIGRITYAGIGFNLVLTGALVLLLYGFDRLAFGLFLPADSSAISIARHINIIALWSFILFGVTIVLFGVVRATGAVVPPLLILCMSLLGVRVPFAKWLQPAIGADAIWWSFPAGSIVSLALAALYYRYGTWRKAHLVTAPPVAGEAPETGVATPVMEPEPTPQSSR